jgi:hypothetical protein
VTRERRLWAAIGVILAGSLATSAATWLNHDVALSLTAATEMLDGVKLYEDLLELNPPLFIVYAMPAAGLSRLTGVSAPFLLLLFVHAIAWVSLRLDHWSLQRSPFPRRPQTGELLLAGLAFLSVPFALPLIGQREHLFALFWMPYPLLRVARECGVPVGRGRALLVGVWAGLGIALKPFFVLPWLGVEAYALARRRRLAVLPETVAAAGVVALYLAAVVVVWPGYFGTIVPLAGTTFWAYNNPLSYVLTRVGALLALAALLAGARAPVRDESLRPLRGVLVASGAGSLLQAVIQSKGWNYHLYPAIVAAGLLALVCAVALWTRRPDGRPFPRLFTAGLPAALVVASLAAGGLGWRRLESMHRPARRLEPVLQECGPGGLVAFLSTDVDPTFPLMTYSHLRWRSRFAAVWPLPAVVKAARAPEIYGATTPELQATERFTVETVVADLERAPPDLLVVDRRRNKQAMEGIAFDFVDYFSREERFRRLFAGYRLARDLGSHTVYVRTSSRSCAALAAQAPPQATR